MNVCRRISLRLHFLETNSELCLMSLLVSDILKKSLSSVVDYWPHTHEEYLWHGAAKYVSSWGIKDIQKWRDRSQGSADLFIPFILTATDKNGSQRTPKSLQMQKQKEPLFFPYLSIALCQHLAGDISKLRNSPSFHFSPAPESKQATPHLTASSQVQCGKWSAPFHRMLS